ncbi:hypothetical protein OH733_05365 [Streptomyces griseus]|uniref:hypothetical protein n=1 Tax=Streptomyces griseus TaxID=1911 RepID=UPI00386DFF6A|nr:hypothetical protein OH733_05365 [Streptomyces griseus]WTD71180.1 hypothetical protein OH763_31620 [Streptomyces griseus]
MFRTTWIADVRMEKGDRYAEYNDTVSVTGDSEPTKDDVIDHIASLIINSHPDMKAGQVVRASARRIG